MHPFLQIVVAIAIVVGVGVFVGEHVTCWHIPYVTSNCVVTK